RSVIENNPLKIGVRVQNKGAYQSNPSIVISTEEDYISIEGDNEKKISLDGKTLSNPDGEYKKIYFDAKAKRAGAQKTKHPTNIIVTACYDYKTLFSDEICINPHQYSPVEEDVCSKTSKDFSSQGAPVVVEEIETGMHSTQEGVQPKILIHVKDKGEGTLLKPASVEDACSSKSLERESIGVVKLESVSIGNNEFPGGGISCDKANVKLVKGKGTFSCKLDNAISENSPAYNAQINMALKYGYTKSISRGVDIEKSI
ncbi:MAG: hypothetical protein ACQESF_04435, partial [Nanobdellota archaeon]